MRVDERIKALLDRDPFLPFVIRRTTGQSIRVILPDQVWLPPGARWMEVFAEVPIKEAGSQRIDLASVSDIVDEARSPEVVQPMTVEKFDEFLKRRPFEPFTIHTADGSKVPVIGPEFASRTQGGRTVFVSTGGEQTEWIDLLLVTRITSGVENIPSGRQ